MHFSVHLDPHTKFIYILQVLPVSNEWSQRENYYNLHEADQPQPEREAKDQRDRGTKTPAVLRGTKEQSGKSWDSSAGSNEDQDYGDRSGGERIGKIKLSDHSKGN